MKRISVVVLIVASVVLFMFACVSNQPPTSIARNIGYFSPYALKRSCEKNGGLYSPPSAGGLYYCLLPSGALIVCDATGTCTYDPRKSGKPPPHDFVNRLQSPAPQ
jgi:hypothetical protein